MKINKQKLSNNIEEIIANGVAYTEEIDITTKKVMDSIDELIVCVEQLNVSDGWISVEDRLPENNKHHNILLNGDRNSSHHIYYVAGYDNMYKEWLNPFGDNIEEKVTHWMPLPTPPQLKQK